MRIVFDTDHHRLFTHAECCVSVYDHGRYFSGEAFERNVD